MSKLVKLGSSLASPVRIIGGKSGLVNKILPMIPEHRHYAEVFGGGAWVLLAKDPSPVETYNDVDGGLVNFWRVVRDPDLFPELQRRLELTLYSEEEYYSARNAWQEAADPLEKAFLWFVHTRSVFGGIDSGANRGWAYNITGTSRGMAGIVSAWLSAIENLPAVHARLRRVQIARRDWRKLLETFDREDTFFYLDPPYYPDTRKSGGYAHELTREDHAELVWRLLVLRGKALLSGYANPAYKGLEIAGWRRWDIEVVCQTAGKTRKSGLQGEGAGKRGQGRTESLWANYDPPRIHPALTRVC